MLAGKTINELATEVIRQRDEARDFLAPAATLTMRDDGTLGVGEDSFPLRDIADRQVQQYADIPAKYYRRLREEDPALLATNVNRWLREKNGDRRLVRTLDGSARAFLSDRYRILDSGDLIEATVPLLSDLGATIRSTEITDTRLYVKATLPSLTRRIEGSKVGDVVSAGVIIVNSEVGHSSLRVERFIETLACTNGMVVPTSQGGGVRKYHIGRAVAQGDEGNVEAVLSDDTRRIRDAAVWSVVRDVTRAAFNERFFNETVDRLQAATADRIEAKDKLEDVVEAVVETVNLPRSSSGSILGHLAEGGDLSRYGLLNAVTRAAQDVDSYDVSTDMEAAGGRILTLGKRDWRRISEAVLRN